MKPESLPRIKPIESSKNRKLKMSETMIAKETKKLNQSQKSKNLTKRSQIVKIALTMTNLNQRRRVQKVNRMT